MSEVKPDCYCLGGNEAHYSQRQVDKMLEESNENFEALKNVLHDTQRQLIEAKSQVEGLRHAIKDMKEQQ